MTSRGFTIVPGLTVRFEALAEGLDTAISNYLGGFDGSGPPGGGHVLRVAADPPPVAAEPPRTLVRNHGLSVRTGGDVTIFEMEGIVGWCRSGAGRGGIFVQTPSASVVREFVGLALAPLLIELAEPRGCLGLHAAAVAVDGLGILLPGHSGAGKSTIFRNCFRAGLGVLSDDLVWLRENADGGFRVFPFPRGFTVRDGEEDVPKPSVRGAPVETIVCPGIADREASRLVPLSSSQALDVLLAQSGFLGARPGADRFRALVRLAGSVPCRRLEAGRRLEEAPRLLQRLAAELADRA